MIYLQSENYRKAKERMTATALYICLGFLILTSPSAVFILMMRLNGWLFNMPENVRVYDTFIFFVRSINFSMNFFIYLACNVQFRAATRRLLRRPGTVEPNSSQSATGQRK